MVITVSSRGSPYLLAIRKHAVSEFETILKVVFAISTKLSHTIFRVILLAVFKLAQFTTVTYTSTLPILFVEFIRDLRAALSGTAY